MPLLVKGALEVNETRLHKELFKGYNKHAHPRLPGTGPVTVTFDFQLIRILDVVRFYNLKLDTSVCIVVESRVFHAICINLHYVCTLRRVIKILSIRTEFLLVKWLEAVRWGKEKSGLIVWWEFSHIRHRVSHLQHCAKHFCQC